MVLLGRCRAQVDHHPEVLTLTTISRSRYRRTATIARCGNPKVLSVASMLSKWQCYQCETVKDAGYRFSHIAGTIFENTNKPLREWLKVTHLMLTSKKRSPRVANSAGKWASVLTARHTVCAIKSARHVR
jgi:hypothetical protein